MSHLQAPSECNACAGNCHSAVADHLFLFLISAFAVYSWVISNKENPQVPCWIIYGDPLVSCTISLASLSGPVPEKF